MTETGPPIVVQEVGLRDGAQSLARTIPTAAKLRWIDAAYAAGVRHMEVASFVPPRLLPQMADAAVVVAHALTLPGLRVAALAPNLKGAQLALAAGVHEMVAPLSVSTAHSLANVRKTPQAMVDEFQQMVAWRDSSGSHTRIVAGLSTVFGCTLQGAVPLEQVCELARLALQAGADTIALADTTGHATPGQVGAVIAAVRAIAGAKLTTLHLHDTRGLGLANTVVALQHGIRRFDASLAGLGGCPHAPGATGNVVAEDLVFMLESMGYATGIDLPRLLEVRAIIAQALPGEPLYGYLARAGMPADDGTHPGTHPGAHPAAPAASFPHEQGHAA
jgi:hydroxymethylglutaryl-CoA lyase